MKYALKNENGYITHVFDVKDGCDLKYFLEGDLYLVDSWSVNDKTPIDFSFICELSSKWDGCSHFYFNGEDYKKTGETDSYYHLCGGHTILKFIIGIAFVIELAETYIEEEQADISDFDYITTLNLLENYKIIEWDGEVV